MTVKVKSYSEKLKDPRWQKVRLSIFQRDNWKCRDCGAIGKSLQVHHCHYEKGNPWDTRKDLLMTLCDECHPVRQENEDNLKKVIGEFCVNQKPDGVLEFAMKLAQFIHLNPKEIPILFEESYAMDLYEKSKGLK